MASNNRRRSVSDKDIAFYCAKDIFFFARARARFLFRNDCKTASFFSFVFGSTSDIERDDADDGAARERADRSREHHRHHDAARRWIDYFRLIIKRRYYGPGWNVDLSFFFLRYKCRHLKIGNWVLRELWRFGKQNGSNGSVQRDVLCEYFNFLLRNVIATNTILL